MGDSRQRSGAGGHVLSTKELRWAHVVSLIHRAEESLGMSLLEMFRHGGLRDDPDRSSRGGPD
eukprot:3421418-Pyramimonas_sp.AAC.1